MKTNEELFDEYATKAGSDILKCLDRSEFRKALRKHDKEIISLIDEMIKKNEAKVKGRLYPNQYDYKIQVLTELKQKIQSL